MNFKSIRSLELLGCFNGLGDWRDDKLDVAWFVIAGIDTAVGAVVSAVVDLTRKTNVVEADLKVVVFGLVKVLSVVGSLYEEISDSASGLLWPSALVGTPNVSLWVSGSALLELEEWDDFVVLDDIVEVFKSTLDLHTLDGSANAVSFLVRDSGVVGTRLADLFVARLESILPCHLPKEVEWDQILYKLECSAVPTITSHLYIYVESEEPRPHESFPS